MKGPEKLLDELFLEIKSKNRILPDDVRLSPVERLEFYSPIIIEKGEDVEIRVYNFLKMICEKANYLKKTKDANEYMRLFNEFKTITLTL